ncbi:MAG: NAD-dependent epimerase/dehydratase family protein [Rhodocyclaceae bacterium]|nr:NAD-dependent epimerase/dehydratase family protein [Rhodocyclaceae bacterium]
MKIFITGASGFVGGAASRRLIAEGCEVVAMSRSESSDKKISALGATPSRCDLDSISPANIAGCDIVIHAAAHVEAWGDVDAWDKANVQGTKNVLTAARAAGARRFIHIGTEAALVRGQDLIDVDETYPLAFDSPFPYCRTKALAEQAVLAANTPQGNFTTIVLRPRFIWGPGDTTILPSILEMAAAGKWTWIDGGAAMTSTTYIENLVDAILLAREGGKSGEAYFILDEGTRTMREIVSGMALAHGVVLPDRSMPGWLARGIGSTLEFSWRICGIKSKPVLTAHEAMVMSRHCTLNGAKATRDLAYRPSVSVAAGLAAMKP